jgi:prepilin-type processing-associated H-X9-DG protein
MTTWFNLESDWSGLTLTVLGHFLWQGALIGLLAALGAYMMRKSRPKVLYGWYVCALAGMALCIPVTFFVVGNPHVENVQSAITFAGPDTPLFPVVRILEEPPPVVTSDSTVPETKAVPALPPSGNYWPQIQRAMWFGWNFGVALLALRLITSLFLTNILGFRARRVHDSDLVEALTQQSAALGISRVPNMAWCKKVTVPMVVGIVRPVILLPLSFSNGLTTRQVEMILCHELAHIRRLDPIVNLMQRLLETVLFYHPAVWFVSRQIREQRELCCDDAVTKIHGQPREYADSLVELAIHSTQSKPYSTAMSAIGTKSEFSRRIVRLLGGPAIRSSYPAGGITMTIFMSTLLVIAAAVYGQPEKDTAPKEEHLAEPVPETHETQVPMPVESAVIPPVPLEPTPIPDFGPKKITIDSPAIVPLVRTTERIQVASLPDKMKPMIEILIRYWDGEIIPGTMVDEIRRVMKDGDATKLKPLLDRIQLLDRSGDIYAEDFALWWRTHGRREVAGRTLWRRDLLKEALKRSFEGNDESAYQLLQKAAESGDPVAMMWQLFSDMPRDRAISKDFDLKWSKLEAEVRKLAESGDPEAAFFLGSMSFKGPELAERVAWMEMAAESGNPLAIKELAVAYKDGQQGIEPDPSKARYWEHKLGIISPETRAASDKQNSAINLKQLGLALKMFGAEARGEKYPPLSPEVGQLTMDPKKIYPEYMSDANVFVSPAHPDAAELISSDDPTLKIRDHSFWYMSYAIPNAELGLAFIEEYKKQARTGKIITEDFDHNRKPIFRLREGIERFFITDINDPNASAKIQSSIPLLIERPGLHDGGGHVLYMDGHVEFVPYPGKFPMTQRFIEALESVDRLKKD